MTDTPNEKTTSEEFEAIAVAVETVAGLLNNNRIPTLPAPFGALAAELRGSE